MLPPCKAAGGGCAADGGGCSNSHTALPALSPAHTATGTAAPIQQHHVRCPGEERAHLAGRRWRPAARPARLPEPARPAGTAAAPPACPASRQPWKEAPCEALGWLPLSSANRSRCAHTRPVIAQSGEGLQALMCRRRRRRMRWAPRRACRGVAAATSRQPLPVCVPHCSAAPRWLHRQAVTCCSIGGA